MNCGVQMHTYIYKRLMLWYLSDSTHSFTKHETKWNYGNKQCNWFPAVAYLITINISSKNNESVMIWNHAITTIVWLWTKTSGTYAILTNNHCIKILTSPKQKYLFINQSEETKIDFIYILSTNKEASVS